MIMIMINTREDAIYFESVKERFATSSVYRIFCPWNEMKITEKKWKSHISEKISPLPRFVTMGSVAAGSTQKTKQNTFK